MESTGRERCVCEAEVIGDCYKCYMGPGWAIVLSGECRQCDSEEGKGGTCVLNTLGGGGGGALELWVT